MLAFRHAYWRPGQHPDNIILCKVLFKRKPLPLSLSLSLSLFGLQVSGTEEGRQGPMCGRIASASQTCTDFGCCFGQWFCSDFFRIVVNSPLFAGCLQTWIRNFFSTESHWCRSVCNEPRECYCSLHFREPPSAQLRPRRPQGVYRD